MGMKIEHLANISIGVWWLLVNPFEYLMLRFLASVQTASPNEACLDGDLS